MARPVRPDDVDRLGSATDPRELARLVNAGRQFLGCHRKVDDAAPARPAAAAPDEAETVRRDPEDEGVLRDLRAPALVDQRDRHAGPNDTPANSRKSAADLSEFSWTHESMAP